MNAEEAAGVDYAALGPYVAVGGGAALADIGRGASGMLRLFFATRPDTASGVYNLRAGYRFHPNLAAELLWDYETGWDFRSLGDRDFRASSVSLWSLTANLKAYLTRTKWQPFVVGGIGLGRRDTDGKGRSCDYVSGCRTFLGDKDEAFLGRIGVGLDVHVTEAWQLGGEVVYVLGSGALRALDFTTTTLVITYNFH